MRTIVLEFVRDTLVKSSGLGDVDPSVFMIGAWRDIFTQEMSDEDDLLQHKLFCNATLGERQPLVVLLEGNTVLDFRAIFECRIECVQVDEDHLLTI